MPSKIMHVCCLIVAVGLTAGGCGVGAEKTPPSATTASSPSDARNARNDVKQAVAVVHATAGNKVSGKVQFSETADGKVKVVADLEGLAPHQ